MTIDLARIARLIQEDLADDCTQEEFARRVNARVGEDIVDQGKISKLGRGEMPRPSARVIMALGVYFGSRLYDDPAHSVPASGDGARPPMPDWLEDLVDMATEKDELREAWAKVHRLWVMSRKPLANMSKENWTHLLKQTRTLIFEAERSDFPPPKPTKKRPRDRAAGERGTDGE